MQIRGGGRLSLRQVTMFPQGYTDSRYWESSQVEEADSSIYRSVSDNEEDWTGGVRDWFANSLGKLAQCLPCITVEEVHCRPFACTRGGRCPSA